MDAYRNCFLGFEGYRMRGISRIIRTLLFFVKKVPDLVRIGRSRGMRPGVNLRPSATLF